MSKKANICFISKLYHYNSSKVQRLIHLHDRVVEIILIVNGKSEYVIDGVPREIKKGDVVICPQGLSHYEKIEKNEQMDYFCLGLDNFSEFCFPDNSGGLVCFSGSNFALLKKMFENLYDDLGENSSKSNKTVDDFVSCVADLCCDSKKSSCLQKNIINFDALSYDIFKYISGNFEKAEITLEHLSDVFHVSESLISHKFSDTYNMPPMKFLQSCRIGATQSELVVTDKLITEISFDAGYNNLSNYNATFLKRIGMSPRQYRFYYRALDYKQVAHC